MRKQKHNHLRFLKRIWTLSSRCDVSYFGDLLSYKVARGAKPKSEMLPLAVTENVCSFTRRPANFINLMWQC